jgi:hypothetical protein
VDPATSVEPFVVIILISPDVDGVYLYQTLAMPLALAWFGSPASIVAPIRLASPK